MTKKVMSHYLKWTYVASIKFEIINLKKCMYRTVMARSYGGERLLDFVPEHDSLSVAFAVLCYVA